VYEQTGFDKKNSERFRKYNSVDLNEALKNL
jgi:hypothetical protein